MMKILRERLESGFGRFSIHVFDRPWIVIAGIALFMAFLVIQLPQLTFDVTLEGQFRKDDTTYENYLKFKQQYGDDSTILVGIRSENIFSKPFLEKLRRFHNDLEKEMPYLDEITSLINVNNIRAEDDLLIVQDLMKEWPRTEEQVNRLKAIVMRYPAYQNVLISDDGFNTAIYLIPDVRTADETDGFSFDDEPPVEQAVQQSSLISRILKVLTVQDKAEHEKKVTEELTLTNEQRAVFVGKVREVAARYDAEDFSIFITGGPAILNDHLAQVERNMPRGILGSVIGILILIYLIFRRLVPVVLTLLVVMLSLLTVFGASSILNIPIRTSTLVYPPIIMAAGVCDAIHLFTIFFQQLRKGADKKQAIAHAMRHSGLAMLFTSITTMGGFLAFAYSELAGIVELGLCAAIGVMMALLLTYLLVPALLALLPISIGTKNRSLDGVTAGFWNNNIKRLCLFSVKRPGLILSITAVIAVVAVVGATRITMSFDMLSWFPDGEVVQQDTYQADAAFKGGSVLEVVVDTGRENGLFDPQVMNALQTAQEFTKSLRNEVVWVGKATSIVDTLKQINKVLNEDRAEYYSVPQDSRLIAQELLLFEMDGLEDLEDLVDSRFSQARLTLKVPSVDGAEFAPFRDNINREFSRIFVGKAEIYLTGAVDLFVQSVWGLMNSMTSSYMLAAMVITLLLLLLTGSLRTGLAGMIPNFFPVLVVLGMMGYAGIPISIFTVLLGGIALGLAVDDTVHFLHNFRRNFDRNRNVAASVAETIESTGRALLFTTMSLSIGFLAFLTADMNVLRSFGMLTGLTMVIALLSDLTIIPALMSLLYRVQEQPAVPRTIGRPQAEVS
ncbi:MAG: MMPL family transporter [Desulfobacteraceae bacterium]|nr:MMPL family transporter [Desulfobacteraceae bacterium]